MEWVYTFAIIFLATVMSLSTGFGFAIVAVPLLLLVHNGHNAVTISIAMSLVSGLIALPHLIKDIDKHMLKTLISGSVFGLPLGGVLFYTMNVQWIKLVVSIAILTFTIPLLLRIRIPLGSGRTVGFISGVLTSSIGMAGAPVALYLTSLNTDKSKFRGTSIAYYCLVFPISLLIQFFSGKVAFAGMGHLIAVIPAIFLGQAVGKAIHGRLNHAWFQRVTIMILLATAINALIQSL